ncbi:DNA replication protein [Azospirillaceae bacterium]
MRRARQLALALEHRPSTAQDDFLVSPCNADAVAWIDHWPNWPGPALVVCGPPGCGKSHLVAVWLNQTEGRGITGEALNTANVPALISSVDEAARGKTVAVAVDNADCVAGDASGERALFHLYNLVQQHHGRLLLTAVEPPSRWGVRLPDLRSRMLAAPVAPVAPPDDELLAGMLIKLFADRQLYPPVEVVTYLVRRMERSYDVARRMVTLADRAALAGRRRITVSLIKEIMQPAPSSQTSPLVSGKI